MKCHFHINLFGAVTAFSWFLEPRCFVPKCTSLSIFCPEWKLGQVPPHFHPRPTFRNLHLFWPDFKPSFCLHPLNPSALLFQECKSPICYRDKKLPTSGVNANSPTLFRKNRKRWSMTNETVFNLSEYLQIVHSTLHPTYAIVEWYKTNPTKQSFRVHRCLCLFFIFIISHH